MALVLSSKNQKGKYGNSTLLKIEISMNLTICKFVKVSKI